MKTLHPDESTSTVETAELPEPEQANELDAATTDTSKIAAPVEAKQESKENGDESTIVEANNILVQIWNAEQSCREKESTLDSLKEEVKDAKESLDSSIERLRDLAQQINTNGNKIEESESAREDQPAGDWKIESIKILFAPKIKGFGQAKVDALIDLTPTLGDFEDLRCKVGKDADQLCKLLPKGVGQTLADELENRHLSEVAKYSDQPAASKTVAELMWERVAKLDTGNEEWMDGQLDKEVWDAGYEAFDNGLLIDACPYGFDSEAMLDEWLRGYCAAKATQEFEDAKSDPGSSNESDVVETEPEITVEDL